MTREEAISIMNVIVHMLEPQYDTDRIEDAVEMAIKALEQEPCDDVISKRAVVDAIADTIVYGESLGYGLAEEIVSEIPPIKPQVKTGHWIELGCVGNDNYNFECSECHHTDTQSKAVKVNYCWYCGAKMIEPQERGGKE